MSESALIGRQRELGGTIGRFAGAEVVRHYGDADAEYRVVRESAGIVLRTDLGIVRMTGRDPVRMLNGLITNDLAKAERGRAVYGAMLTPKGRTITDLRAVRVDSDVLFDFPMAAAEEVTAQLKKYLPPMFARWAMDEDAAIMGVYGPRSIELMEALTAAASDSTEDMVLEATIAGVPVLTIGTSIAGREPGVDILVPGAGGETVWDALVEAGSGVGARPVGLAALEVLRIEAGRPRFGHEITEESLPAEVYGATGLMPRAVSFDKGCYTGQEVVVRIAHRGHVNRSVRGLLLGGAPTPAERTPLHRAGDGKEVGWITSSAHSPMMGETIALGVVRREVEVGERLRVGEGGGEEAMVVELPFDPTIRGRQSAAGTGGSKSGDDDRA